jgi:hypothetical protein
LDIKATIPSEATAAEAARQAVRDKYATMQTAIDAATTTDAIKAAIQANHDPRPTKVLRKSRFEMMGMEGWKDLVHRY